MENIVLSERKTNRKQTVDINGCILDLQNVLFGVPEGSVLGSLININDLMSGDPGTDWIIFADDTIATKGAKELYELQTANIKGYKMVCHLI